MKYSFLLIFVFLTSAAQASYCSGKNWQDAYQFYTHNIDYLNAQIDRYNIVLDKNSSPDMRDVKYEYMMAKLAVEELDKLSVDVEVLEVKFNRVKQLWQLISEHCLIDEELDYNRKAIENAQGADIARQEVNDLLSRIRLLRLRFFKIIELVNDGRNMT